MMRLGGKGNVPRPIGPDRDAAQGLSHRAVSCRRRAQGLQHPQRFRYFSGRAMANEPNDDDAGGPDTGTGVVTRTRPKTKKPSLYKVLMLNDDYTPMEFVVHVLQRFFRMSLEDATRVMLHVHQKGVGVCGIFTYEVAETKVTQVMDFAKQHQHPLQCTLEKA
jgi:ATP-dependent Clp protease adaptor protein ClpS